MNERFKQLAEQAGYYLYDLTETHECKTVETDSTDEWITLSKFAELIIAECAQACMNEGASYEEKSAGAYQSNLYVTAIKQHFGVEE